MTRLFKLFICCGVTVALFTAVLAAEPTKRPKPKSENEPSKSEDGDDSPAGTEKYLAKLMAFFEKKDANKDGFLDREELAKHFGYNGSWKDAEKDEDGNPSALPKATLNRRDYKLITMLDNDKDGKISKDEFESWAKDYAAQLATHAAKLAKLQGLQQRTAQKQLEAMMAAFSAGPGPAMDGPVTGGFGPSGGPRVIVEGEDDDPAPRQIGGPLPGQNPVTGPVQGPSQKDIEREQQKQLRQQKEMLKELEKQQKHQQHKKKK